jgi:hypothetical protein
MAPYHHRRRRPPSTCAPSHWQDGGKTHPFTQVNKKSRFPRAVKREPLKAGDEHLVPLYAEALVAHAAVAGPAASHSALAAPWRLLLESATQLVRSDSAPQPPPSAAGPAPAPAPAPVAPAETWPTHGVLLATLRAPDAAAATSRLAAAAARVTATLEAGRTTSEKPFSLAELPGDFAANVEAARGVVKAHACDLVEVDAAALSVRVRGLGTMTVLRAGAELLAWVGSCLVSQRDEAIRKASIEYPVEWESDGSGAAFDPTVPGFELRDVPPGTREHAEVLVRFQRRPDGKGPSFDKAVLRVQRVQNPLAWSRYYTQRRAIAELATNGGDPNELCVCHRRSPAACLHPLGALPPPCALAGG